MQKLLNKPIIETIPHLLQREALYVSPDTQLKRICDFLFAVGPYQDGIIVVEDTVPIGKIGGQHILKQARTDHRKAESIQVNQVMEKLPTQYSESITLMELLELFKTSKFCFIPIKKSNSKIITVSIRDLLPLVAKMDIDTPIKSSLSKLIFVSGNIHVGNVIDLMINHKVRRLGIQNDDETINMITDRHVLEFLCFKSQFEYDLMNQTIEPPWEDAVHVDAGTSLSRVADMLIPKPLGCVINGHNIATPYDIVKNSMFMYAN